MLFQRWQILLFVIVQPPHDLVLLTLTVPRSQHFAARRGRSRSRSVLVASASARPPARTVGRIGTVGDVGLEINFAPSEQVRCVFKRILRRLQRFRADLVRTPNIEALQRPASFVNVKHRGLLSAYCCWPGLMLASVVGQAHCCSVVIVNTKNIVQELTFGSSRSETECVSPPTLLYFTIKV